MPKRCMISNDGGYLDYHHGTGNTIEITSIFIFENCRRQGYATSLFWDFTTQIPPKHNIYLFTEASNTAAHKFYESVGFNQRQMLPDFYPHDDAFVYWMIRE